MTKPHHPSVPTPALPIDLAFKPIPEPEPDMGNTESVTEHFQRVNAVCDALANIQLTPELPAKRTRRPAGPMDEIDRHIAAIQTARHDLKRCAERVTLLSRKAAEAQAEWEAARVKLNRLTAGLTTPQPDTAEKPCTVDEYNTINSKNPSEE